VNHGKLNATLPRALAPETLTAEQALALLADKEAKGGGKPARGRAAGAKSAPKKTAGKKKAPAKRPAGGKAGKPKAAAAG
jgi:DNA topoisomerase-1